MIDFPAGQYRTVLADPPWPESGGGKIKRGADRHYPLMKVAEISAMPVRRLIHPEGCHLYLWTTNNYLSDALAVVKAWGFTYKTLITWAKDGRIGLGQYFRGMTEHCIFAVSRALPYRTRDGKRAQGTTLLGKSLIPRPGAHSVKPRELHEVAELVSWPPRIELFARHAREGWASWGDKIEGDFFSGDARKFWRLEA